MTYDFINLFREGHIINIQPPKKKVQSPSKIISVSIFYFCKGAICYYAKGVQIASQDMA